MCVYSGLVYRMLLGPTVIVFNYIFGAEIKETSSGSVEDKCIVR